MRRRAFLGAVGCTGAALAGCLDSDDEPGETSNQADGDNPVGIPEDGPGDPPDDGVVDSDLLPNPEVVESLSPEVEVEDNPLLDTSVDVTDTGYSGRIAVALFWQLLPTEDTPQSVNIDPLSGPWRREKLREMFVEQGERQMVHFDATPPEDAIQPYFYAEPATYGGRISNKGGSGDVTVSLCE